jgi:UDP-N-acetylglucosamine 4,6-dehydratase
MCPGDDSHLTIEFEDHYVIRPTISFVETVDYTRNPLGERGKQVDDGFEYDSGNNSVFLTIEQIRELYRTASADIEM